MKYLVVGLGNVGKKYENTRHNIGFAVLDELAHDREATFQQDRHGFHTTVQWKGRTLHLVKPTTLVNRSGKAVNYWLQQENIPLERLLIIVDDIDLPLGALRLKPKGGAGGHNGLKDIEQTLGTANYPRLRFGIGQDFPKGRQVEYVLGRWTEEEQEQLQEPIEKAAKAVKSFSAIGLDLTMTEFNE